MPMRVLCEKCSASYTLPDARLVPGKTVQFTCRHCHNRISVAVPVDDDLTEDVPVQDAAPAQDEAQDSTVTWFFAGKDDQPERMTHDEVAAAIGARKIRAQSLLWRRGMGEWQPAGALPEWQAALRMASGSSTAHSVAAQVQPGVEAPTWKMRSSDDPNSDSAQVAMKLPALWVSTEQPSVRSPESAAVQKPASKPVVEPEDDDSTVDDIPVETVQPRPVTGRAQKAREAAAQGKAPEPAWTRWAMTTDPADRTPLEPLEAPVPAAAAADWRKIALGAMIVAVVALVLTAYLAFRLGAVSGQLAAQKASASAPIPAPSAAPQAAPPAN